MAPLPPQPEDSKTVQAIYAAYERENAKEGTRGYLGASIIGKGCERALWYGFRHCGGEKFSGRMLALFRTGDWAEHQFVEELRLIGCTVHDVDEHGEQFEVKALGGHFSGHMDGCALGVPEAPKTWHVLEFKTHNDRSYDKLKRQGVVATKPMHWAQMQIYMHLTGMTRALYLAKNKNDDQRYAERVKYDARSARALMDKAERIITSATPPAKAGTDRDHYACQWCEHKDRCHGSETPGSSPAVDCNVSCRTCVHSTPRLDGEGGRWTCDKHKKSLSRAEQDRACSDHLFIPELVNFAQVVDAGYDPDGDWTEYRNGDGTTWRNGKAGHVYTSKDLAHLPGPVVGRGAVDDAKAVFDVTVEGVRMEAKQ